MTENPFAEAVSAYPDLCWVRLPNDGFVEPFHKTIEEPSNGTTTQPDSHLRPTQTIRPRAAHLDRYGLRHEKLLPGEYGSEESLAAKARLELALATSPTRNAVDSNDITIAELMATYLVYATRYYVDAEGRTG